MLKRILVFLLVICFIVGVIPVNALSLSAESAVLIDAESGYVIYNHNANKRLSMASTTKIMTSLLLCENVNLDTTVKITAEMLKTEGSSMGLRIGEEVPFKALLYGMLLNSGNDAANATAIAIGGSMENFVALMNDKAKALGLNSTHFDTPSGLDGDTHYTTALDLANLTRYALENELFAEVCAKPTASLNYGGTTHYFKNHNRLLNEYEGAIGVKTGYTMKSGRCLVSAAQRDDITLIAVTLNDRDDWRDHKNLLDYGFEFDGFTQANFNEESYNVNVVSGSDFTLNVKSDAVSIRCIKGQEIVKKVYLPKIIYAPVIQGQAVGYIEYTNGGKIVARQPLKASVDIAIEPKPSFIKRFSVNFKKILKYI